LYLGEFSNPREHGLHLALPFRQSFEMHCGFGLMLKNEIQSSLKFLRSHFCLSK
jgi:hypothetical protein